MAPRPQYIQKDLDRAIRMVRKHQKSLGHASKKTGVPKSTIYDHVYGRYQAKRTHYGGQPILNDEEEQSVVWYCKYMEISAFPLTRELIKSIVKRVIKKTGRKTRMNTARGPSDKWMRSFLTRHENLSVICERTLDKSKAKSWMDSEVWLDSKVWNDPGDVADPPTKRECCTRCLRPSSVCWCPFLPSVPLEIQTNIFVLQHPFEASRSLSTTPMLYYSLADGKCHILKGKKFSQKRYPDLWETLQSPETLLMYPCAEADDISSIAMDEDTAYNLVVLDGTWAQAKAIYNQNPILKTLRKVRIRESFLSRYVVRSQPNDSCLSTLEAAAIALSQLEKRPEILEMLLKPLNALCDFQLQHGAEPRQSKQYLIENGLYKKKIKKSVMKKLSSASQTSSRD